MKNEKSVFYKMALGNLLVLLLPILVAFIATLAFGLARYADAQSPLFWMGIVLMVIGWVLLVRSKWPQLRGGDLSTFGVSQANAKNRNLYWASYIVMVSGYLLSTFSGYR